MEGAMKAEPPTRTGRALDTPDLSWSMKEAVVEDEGGRGGRKGRWAREWEAYIQRDSTQHTQIHK